MDALPTHRRTTLSEPFRIEGLAPDHVLNAFLPVNSGIGPAFFESAVLAPLRRAFPRAVVKTDIAIRGAFSGGDWTAAHGHVLGVFERPFFGIRATARFAHLRFGCFQRWAGGAVAETILLLDLPALMMQAGVWPLAPPLGPLIMAPAPGERDALFPDASPAQSAQSLALVEAMIGGLMQFDGKSLQSMGMRRFWSDDFLWHGPGPIGSFQGHTDYERGHQRPFLAAFPDRVGGNHRARLAQGAFVASTGWPSIRATHKGGAWLGLAPTGRAVTMRVMDFWRRDGDRLSENWVMIDILDLLTQLDIDIFERMTAAFGRDGSA